MAVGVPALAIGDLLIRARPAAAGVAAGTGLAADGVVDGVVVDGVVVDATGAGCQRV